MTVTAWRIVKSRYAATAFSGEGARQFGGRWNRPGYPVVYLAGSQALAILEMLVHLQGDELGKFYTIFRLQLPPDLIEIVPPADLPEGWAADPVPIEVADFGTMWGRSGRSCVLRVPSALASSGEEYYYLVNPAHPRFKDILIGPATPFQFDPRLA